MMDVNLRHVDVQAECGRSSSNKLALKNDSLPSDICIRS